MFPFPSLAHLKGATRRRKNMTEFLGDANIPSPDALAQLGGSLPPAIIPGPESWKNRAASRFSGFFGAGTFGKVGHSDHFQTR